MYASNCNHILEPTIINNINRNSNLLYNFKTQNSNDLEVIKTNDSNSNNTNNSLTDSEFTPVFSLNQDLDFFESKYSYPNNNSRSIKDDFISEFESMFFSIFSLTFIIDNFYLI